MISQEDYSFYVNGAREIVNHIYEPGFSMEKAMIMAPKVIYMATCLLTGKSFVQPEDPENLREEKLQQEDRKNMRSFRKVRGDSYAYLVLAYRLLTEYR